MTRQLFEILSDFDEATFQCLLQSNDPNSKMHGIPLLHYVVRTAGPIRLQLLIEAGVDVNALTTNGTPPTSALQWITGMINSSNFNFGWPLNYESHLPSTRDLRDRFFGSAHEIMHQIATILLRNGAKKDFYSACALGDCVIVSEYITQRPVYLFLAGPDGSSALAWAARRGQHEVMGLLLSLGANVNQKNINNDLTPVEEAILAHGTLATVQLLIEKGAWIRRNVIGGVCRSRLDIVDYLLSHVKTPSKLITVNDINVIQNKKYYKQMLQIFYKHQVSLNKIDQVFITHNCALIFDGCIKSINILRLLIALGCNINIPYQPNNSIELIGRENDPIIGSKPMVYLAIIFRNRDAKKALVLLQKMAILFFYGAGIEPSHPNQPHPINDLPNDALIDFLLYLYEEIKTHGATSIAKQSEANLAIVSAKIKHAAAQTKDESILAKLAYLALYCEPLSLQKTCIHYIIQHGLIANIQHLPVKQQEQIQLLSKTR